MTRKPHLIFPNVQEPLDGVDKDTILDLTVHSRIHMVSGGTRIVQHDPPPKSSSGGGSSGAKEGASRPPDNGCVGYVLRTGFNTSQVSGSVVIFNS